MKEFPLFLKLIYKMVVPVNHEMRVIVSCNMKIYMHMWIISFSFQVVLSDHMKQHIL